MRPGKCGKFRNSRDAYGAGNAMLNCRLDPEQGRPLTILCLGAHSDDIEIGCGGTILKLIEEHERTELYWVVFSAAKRRRREAKESASAF
jgi:LmbE family N-acetylglucosaminyl deacetylase